MVLYDVFHFSMICANTIEDLKIKKQQRFCPESMLFYFLYNNIFNSLSIQGEAVSLYR